MTLIILRLQDKGLPCIGQLSLVCFGDANMENADKLNLVLQHVQSVTDM